MRTKDITGQKINKLLAIRVSHVNKQGNAYWIFKCDCGVEKAMKKSNVMRGGIKSCGCYFKENCGKWNKGSITHGKSRTPVYNAWIGIRARCLNKNNRTYKHYGGIGIKVCERWIDSFENFLADMGEPPSPKHSIDRIDVTGNYEPSNCRWATWKEQARNKRDTKFITYKAESKSLPDWCDELKLSLHLIKSRLFNGWSIEKAFETPLQVRKSKPTQGGRWKINCLR